MYSPLKFSSFEATRQFCFNSHRSMMEMLVVNNSPYLNGYHGMQHMLYALNTFSFLNDSHPMRDKTTNDIIWYPLKEDLLDLQADQQELTNMVVALVWHDCNYLYPDDDAENTRNAIHTLCDVYDKYDNEDDRIGFNIHKVCYYINQLRFPLPYNNKTGNYEIANNPCVHILRDCDLSMMLYPEYFDEDQLFNKLLREEFSGFSKSELIKMEEKYIDDLKYYTPYLQKVLEKIGKQNLLDKAIKAINKFVF